MNNCDPNDSYESETGDCDDGYSAEPIRYNTGQIVYSKSLLATTGFGFPWGHKISYNNLAAPVSAAGVNGRGWYVSQTPYLAWTAEGLVVVEQAINNDWFNPELSGAFSNAFDGNAAIVVNVSGDYELTRENGRTWTFFGAGPLLGRLKSIADAFGHEIDLTWNSTSGHLINVTWAGDSQARSFSYTYVPTGPNLGLLESVTYNLNGRSVQRVTFEYYDGSMAGGGAGTLACITLIQLQDELSQEVIVSRTGFRYYLSGEAHGFEGGMKFIFEAKSMEALRSQGINWKAADDSAVASFADNKFEYDSSFRVSKEIVRGGTAEYDFAYFVNPADHDYGDVSIWDVETIETLPDGNELRVYTNKAGQTLAKVFAQAGTSNIWVTSWEYSSTFRLLRKALPSAVDSITEPMGGAGPLVVNLRPSAGLIEEWSYYDADDDPSGAAKGFRESAGFRQGTSGTLMTTNKWTYDTQTVGSFKLRRVRAALTFPVAGVPDSSAPVTHYERSYFNDASGDPTLQVLEVITTPPVIPVAQNGTNATEPSSQVFDEQGRVVWERNPRGFISFRAYDEATGALIVLVNDVNTSLMVDVPVGWVTPPGGGLHLITDYECDALGRNTRTLAPWIEIDPATIEADATAAIRVRPVSYTLYRDSRHSVWRAQGYMTDEGEGASWHIVGPVLITLMDEAGNVSDEIQAPPACQCGPLGPDTFDRAGKLPPQSSWSRWTHNELDLWGRIVETRVYHTIPSSGTGFPGINYNASTIAYDEMGRQIRQTSPGGTITRNVYDSRGLRIATWVGTDDSADTSANNMRMVWLGVYDDGAPGRDGNLTSVTKPINDDTSNDRTTIYTYDFRDRQIQSEESDGVRTFFSVLTYDNLNQVIEQALFHTSVGTSNRTQDSTTSFDDRGRPYEQRRFYVNANGTLGDALVAGTWYDPNSNIIKQTQQGLLAVTKTVFDSLDRPQTQYVVSEAASIADQNTNDVTLDIVISQVESEFNDANQVVARLSMSRFDDTAGTGSLQGPSAVERCSRNSYLAIYNDPVGRNRFTANFGTNGGSVWARPSLHPSPSDTILVTEQRYAVDGLISSSIDPQGTVTEEQRDQAGRRIQMTENAGALPSSQRVSQFLYAPDGGLQRLILINSTTGEQVTTWLYGTSLANSGVARSDLPVLKTYPTGESETQTYNRQGEVLTMTDPNGTTHTYSRDKLGRLTNDSITVLGVGVDGLVRRISTSYDERGRVQLVTSGSAPEPDAGIIVNQVAYTYNGIDCPITEAQSSNGAVDASTPAVQYACTAARNRILRRTSIIYPNGRTISYEYGEAGSIDDVLNRVQSAHDDDLAVLAEFNYLGTMTPSVSTLP